MAVFDNRITCLFHRLKHPGQYNMADVHFHDEHELYYLIEGHTKYFIEDELFLLNPGDIIFVPRGTFHKTNSDAERILLTFDKDYAGEDYQEYIDELSRDKHIIIRSKYQSKIRDIFHQIEKENLKQEKDYTVMQKLYIRELLVLISRYRTSKNTTKFNHSYAVIQDVAKYISANYADDLSLKALSEHFALSPNHLSKQFKKVTEIGLNDYINITRISAAEKLLLNTDASITEVAAQCGFNDSNYFAAVFKKTKGMTPKKYSLINK